MPSISHHIVAAFESGQDRTPSRAAKNQPLNGAELEAHEAQRDLASELLQSIHEMNAGQVKVVASPAIEARK